MEFKNKIIRIKKKQTIVEIENVGSFRFVENTEETPVTCWECDLRTMGICCIIPCYMSDRHDYKDGVFESLNKSLPPSRSMD